MFYYMLMCSYYAILNFDSNLSLIWMVLRFLFLFACELTYHITIICLFCVISIYCLLCIVSQICLLNIVFTNFVSANFLSTTVMFDQIYCEINLCTIGEWKCCCQHLSWYALQFLRICSQYKNVYSQSMDQCIYI